MVSRPAAPSPAFLYMCLQVVGFVYAWELFLQLDRAVPVQFGIRPVSPGHKYCKPQEMIPVSVRALCLEMCVRIAVCWDVGDVSREIVRSCSWGKVRGKIALHLTVKDEGTYPLNSSNRSPCNSVTSWTARILEFH
jgi:hypothetical protein